MKNYKKKLAGLVGILLTATMILSGCGSKEKEDTLETPEAVPTDAAVEAESTADNQSAETEPIMKYSPMLKLNRFRLTGQTRERGLPCS